MHSLLAPDISRTGKCSVPSYPINLKIALLSIFVFHLYVERLPVQSQTATHLANPLASKDSEGCNLERYKSVYNCTVVVTFVHICNHIHGTIEERGICNILQVLFGFTCFVRSHLPPPHIHMLSTQHPHFGKSCHKY